MRAARLDLVRNDSGEWFWRFFAINGKELARSSETYKRRRACEHSARLTLGLNPYSAFMPLEEGAVMKRNDDTWTFIRVRVIA